MGTRVTLFSVNVRTQKYRGMNVNVFACFTETDSTIDCISHQKLIIILNLSGMNKQVLNVISELYCRKSQYRKRQNNKKRCETEMCASSPPIQPLS